MVKKKIIPLLRWSERYTRTDMVYLARGGAWLGAGQIISSGLVFLSAIAFANLLPQETYGNYRYIVSIASILSITTLTGMGGAITQAVARGFEGSFIPALKARISWGMIGLAIGLGISGYYFLHHNSLLGWALLISAIFVPFVGTFNEFDSLLNGKKLFSVSTTYNSIIKIVGVLAVIATIFLTDNVLLLLAIYFGGYTLVRLFFLRRTLKKYPPNSLVDPLTVSYGKHSSVAAGLATGANYLDRLLLFHFLGPIDLAIYSFAIAPIEQSKVLFKSLPTLALPKFAQKSFDEINPMLYKRLGLLFLFGVGAAAIYYFIAPFVYQIIFPNYLDSVKYSQLFALTLLFTLPQNIFSPALNSKLTLIPKRLIYLWNLPDLVLIGSLIGLTAAFGIFGVIISRIFAKATIILVNFYIWKKIQPNKI